MATLQLPVQRELGSFKFTTPLDGRVFEYDFNFNSRFERWFVSVRDEDGNDVVLGRAINVNTDLLNRFRIEGLPQGLMFALNLGEPFVEATFESFERDVKLLYVEAQ